MILKSGFVKVLRASRRSESDSEGGGQKKQDFLRDPKANGDFEPQHK